MRTFEVIKAGGDKISFQGFDRNFVQPNPYYVALYGVDGDIECFALDSPDDVKAVEHYYRFLDTEFTYIGTYKNDQ